MLLSSGFAGSNGAPGTFIVRRPVGGWIRFGAGGNGRSGWSGFIGLRC